MHERCLVDPWFLRELRTLATEGDGTEGLDRTYSSVDTCAAEFEARRPTTTRRTSAAAGGRPPRCAAAGASRW